MFYSFWEEHCRHNVKKHRSDSRLQSIKRLLNVIFVGKSLQEMRYNSFNCHLCLNIIYFLLQQLLLMQAFWGAKPENLHSAALKCTINGKS